MSQSLVPRSRGYWPGSREAWEPGFIGASGAVGLVLGSVVKWGCSLHSFSLRERVSFSLLGCPSLGRGC